MGVTITGTGMAVPDRVQTAEEIAPWVRRSPEWIRSRTGVLERRIADRPCFEYAGEAARQALGDGGPPDLVVNASTTPWQLIPDTSVFVMRELGFDRIPSFSVHATCLSFLVALGTTVAPLLRTGAYRRILLVSAEVASGSRDPGHPESAVLLGDGAAAAVFEWTDAPSDLLGFAMSTLPAGAELAEIQGAGTRQMPGLPDTPPDSRMFRMDGPRVFRMAHKEVERVMGAMLAEHGLTAGDVDVCVPHQASGPALTAMRSFGIARGNVVDIVGQYGNCIAASLPMALHTAIADGRVQRGSSVLLLGTGAGLHCAAGLLRY